MIKITLITEAANGNVLYESGLPENFDANLMTAYKKAKEFNENKQKKPEHLSVEMPGKYIFKY